MRPPLPVAQAVEHLLHLTTIKGTAKKQPPYPEDKTAAATVRSNNYFPTKLPVTVH
jgi:hypothetical protein